MNRKEAAELLPIIQALAEGKIIECRAKIGRLKGAVDIPNKWTETKEIWCINNLEYRIKPEQEPKYRPFKNAEECWQEMQKHEYFGWVKIDDWYCTIKEIRPTCIFCHGGGDVFYYEDVVKQITFIDGTPFGIKVEE